jgi:hypothetical protein
MDGDSFWAGVGGWVTGALAGVVMMVNAGLLMVVTTTTEVMSRIPQQGCLTLAVVESLYIDSVDLRILRRDQLMIFGWVILGGRLLLFRPNAIREHGECGALSIFPCPLMGGQGS